MAQSVAHLSCKQVVEGSSPFSSSQPRVRNCPADQAFQSIRGRRGRGHRYTDLPSSTLSYRTFIARLGVLLKSVLNTAAEDELITVNPCRIRAASNPPRARPVHPATLDELEVITEAMPERFRAAVLLGAWCALRIGEILELRRADVDLTRGSVHVSRAVSWVRGGPVVGTPKSAAGTRSVSIPPHIVAALVTHLEQHVDLASDTLLFPSRSGQHLQPSVFHTAWRRARSAAGRDDLRVHDLRHTGATLAAMTGRDAARAAATSWPLKRERRTPVPACGSWPGRRDCGSPERHGGTRRWQRGGSVVTRAGPDFEWESN